MSTRSYRFVIIGVGNFWLTIVSLYQRIYEVVRRIPPGNVTSYGKIARMVNTGARQVGYAMAAVTPDLEVPWHRVINSKGELSPRKDGKIDNHQRELLVAEGVLFDQHGRIDFDKFGWIEAELPYFEGGFEE